MLFFLAEYTNVFVVSAVAVTLFWGGWLRPFPSVAWLAIPCNYGVPAVLVGGTALECFRLAPGVKHSLQRKGLIVFGALVALLAAVFMIPVVNAAVMGLFWFLLKVFVVIYAMIWFRGTFPRYRYDQLMNIGWKIMIPIGMGAVLVNAVLGMARR